MTSDHQCESERMTSTNDRAPAAALPGDLSMARALWPVLAASAAGLLPYTVFSTFLVPIADAAGAGIAQMGGLRGLGGLASLVVGAAAAPLIDRWPREWSVAGSLGLLAVASGVGALGEFAAMAVFCFLVGAAMAVLAPALGAIAADRFDGPAAGRAATLVTATQSLTAMLAAPVIALPAALWGWRGDLVAIAVLAAGLAAVLFRREPARRPGTGERVGYIASLRALARVPGLAPLLAVALLRTAAFMGYLSYLAAFYDTRFDLAPGPFALVWTLSGASFFLGNLVVGRIANSARPWLPPERLLLVGLLAALCAVVGVFFTSTLPAALALTALLAASHATVAACVVTLLVRHGGTLRGSALAVNGAAMSLGTFTGSALGALGLGLAGYPGAAAVFGAITAAAVVAALLVPRALGRFRDIGEHGSPEYR
ncbi:Predicted arabinose efflux permease, MFS family [Actinokineospora iranica]|uniref:Predicted arabinose efflux permease, MFS family n=1 Tax=Actinokineospora iranica TaxID=1271860 RepID=A0A1G6LDC7_9PSEU|nr:Predicted arabinose efflux permease, MFS family [Actinokineospora iranica]